MLYVRCCSCAAVWHLPYATLPQVLCVRESSRGGGRLDPARSLLLHVGLPPVPQGWQQGAAGEAGCPEAVGWEANEQGKLLPRWARSPGWCCAGWGRPTPWGRVNCFSIRPVSLCYTHTDSRRWYSKHFHNHALPWSAPSKRLAIAALVPHAAPSHPFPACRTPVPPSIFACRTGPCRCPATLAPPPRRSRRWTSTCAS